MSNHSEHKIPILSFYSGGGFMDMGFEMAGFEIVWTNEFDKVFAKLHAAGITSWRKSRGNGIKGGFNGERGKLTLLFIDKVFELQPTFFVMENVTGLTKSNSTKVHLQKLLYKLDREYFVDHKTLNALEFGVPQFRERVFFVGIRKDNIDEQLINQSLGGWFPFPVNKEYQNAAKKYKWATAVPYGKKLTKPKNLPLELCVAKCLVPFKQENKIPNANEYFNLYLEEDRLKKIQEGETNRPSFKRLHRFKYSPTACYGNNEVHLHPYKHRRLSVREVLRIQGVPDTYVLPAELPLSKKFKMIGNGVPVPLASAVATAVKTFLKN